MIFDIYFDIRHIMGFRKTQQEDGKMEQVIDPTNAVTFCGILFADKTRWRDAFDFHLPATASL